MSIADIPIKELQRMAAEAHQSGNYGPAKSFYVCLIAVINLKYGPKSEQLATNFYKLAEVYADEGNYGGAQTLFKRAIEIWQQSNPQDSESMFKLNDALMRLQEMCDRDQAVLDQEKSDSKNNKHVA